MRVLTQDWINAGFELTSNETPLSGLVDAGHTVAIIPRSDEAKMDAMMNHGFVLDDEKNYTQYNNTMNTVGSIDAKILNQHCKGQGMLTIGGSDYDKKLLKSFAKKYNRAKDVFSLLNGSLPSPLRLITPRGGHWWILIAPRVEQINPTPNSKQTYGTPVGLDPFPMEVLE